MAPHLRRREVEALLQALQLHRVRRHLQRQADVVENRVFRLADRAEHASEDDEALALYESLREDRSTLQFLFDLYRDGPAPAALANIETDCIDASLKELVEGCGYGGGHPASIPASHWWWG